MPNVRVEIRDVLSYARNVGDLIEIADAEVVKDLVAQGVVSLVVEKKLPVKKVVVKRQVRRKK